VVDNAYRQNTGYISNNNMNFRAAQSENPLCDKLMNRYRARTEMAAVRAASTIDMVRQAQSEGANLSFLAQVNQPSVTDIPVQGNRTPAMQNFSRTGEYERSAQYYANENQRSYGNYSKAYATANLVKQKKEYYPARDARISRGGASYRTAQRSAQNNAAPVPVKKRQADLPDKPQVKKQAAKPKTEEIRMARTPFPVTTLLLTFICTVMVFTIIFSFTRIYEYTGEINAIEAAIDDLKSQEDVLKLEVEKRDDIRVIEKIAVEEIGMVRGEQVEKRFVSMKGGDYIEIMDEEDAASETKEQGFFSTILSAISANFEQVREFLG